MMNRSDFSEYLAQKRTVIETALLKIMETFMPENTRLKEAMIYSLMAGGKRMRPILCIAAAESAGGTQDHAMAAACAVEMVHTYSLVHDDLPAMDDDTLRRGKPTCHVVFGEATAILAGDALLTLAFEILSSEGPYRIQNIQMIPEAVRILARAAGPGGMIQGQMEDMAAEGVFLDLDALRHLHALKTGALIEASVELGAVLGRGSAGQVARLKAFAVNIGLAFQVIDDILNVEGDPKIMGKAVGTDRLKKKSTYPSLLGVDSSRAYAARCIDSALHALSGFDNKADPLRAIAVYILERKR